MRNLRVRYSIVFAIFALSLVLLGPAMNVHDGPRSLSFGPTSGVVYSISYDGVAKPGASISLKNAFTNNSNSTIQVVTINIQSDLGQIWWPSKNPLCPTPDNCYSGPYPNASVLSPGETHILNITLTIPADASTASNHPVYGTAALQLVIPPSCSTYGGFTTCGFTTYKDLGAVQSSDMILMYQPPAAQAPSLGLFYWVPIGGLTLVGIGLAAAALTLIRRRR